MSTTTATLNRPVPLGSAALMLLGGVLIGIAIGKFAHQHPTEAAKPADYYTDLRTSSGQPWQTQAIDAPAPLPAGTTLALLTDAGKPFKPGVVYFGVTFPVEQTYHYRSAVVGVALDCQKKQLTGEPLSIATYPGTEPGNGYDGRINKAYAPQLAALNLAAVRANVFAMYCTN